MKKTAILFSGIQGPTPKKWSKNFDERPHRLRTCQVVLIELTFYTKLDRNCGRVHSDALCLRGQVDSQCRCGVCCSHSLMRFNNGSNPQIAPFPRGSWLPTEYMVSWAHPSLQPKQDLERFSRSCKTHSCVQQTHWSVVRGRIYARHACDAAWDIV